MKQGRIINMLEERIKRQSDLEKLEKLLGGKKKAVH